MDENLPITAIDEVDDFLIVGEGSSIIISRLDDKSKKKQIQIFENKWFVSGFTVFRQFGSKSGKIKSYPVFIYGNRWGKIVNLEFNKIVEEKEEISFVDYENINFKEWVKSALFLDDNSNDPLTLKLTLTLCVITALNCLSVWDVNFKNGVYELKLRQSHQYKHKSILYSASLHGQTLEDLLIFSGTVYKEILIWKLCGDSGFTNLFCLTGHDGVIFSINFYPEQMLLLTTSDDRTIRVWEFNKNGEKSSLSDLLSPPDSSSSNVTISCKNVLYGHTARVWNAVLAKDKIASVGEDSNIFIWTMTGEIEKSWQSHSGASIWTAFYNKKSDILYTGADSGSLAQWKIHTEPDEEIIVKLDEFYNSKKDFIKFLKFLNTQNCILILLSNGSLIEYEYKNETWTPTVMYKEKKSRNITKCDFLSKNTKLALGTETGEIIILEKNSNLNLWGNCCEFACNESIRSLKWLNDPYLLYVGAGQLNILKISGDSGENRNYKIENLKKFPFAMKRPGVNSTLIIPSKPGESGEKDSFKYILIGDEVGGIHVLDFVQNTCLHHLKYAHDKSGVTFLTNDIPGEIEESSQKSQSNYTTNILSLGRNGTMKIYDLDLSTGILVEKSCSKFPFEWVSKLVNSELYGPLILGFSHKSFVIYSWREGRIIKQIYCGGGDRLWDFYFYNENESKNPSFVYVTKSYFKLVKNINKCFGAFIKDGTHSKVITNAKIIYKDEEENEYFLTSSDDCSIRISVFYKNEEKYTGQFENSRIKTLKILKSHWSNVKALSVLEKAGTGKEDQFIKYFFSGGGKSQLIFWKINFDKIIKCQEISSAIVGLQSEFDRDSFSDHRIMDISSYFYSEKNTALAFCACSDGIGRIMSFNMDENENKRRKMVQIGELSGISHCLMKIDFLELEENRLAILSVTSSGLFCVWFIESLDSLYLSEKLNLKVNFEERIHNCAITAFHLYPGILEEDEDTGTTTRLICTGGDDGVIKLFRIKILEKNKIEFGLYSELKSYIPRSTITSVQIQIRNGHDSGQFMDNSKLNICAISTEQTIIKFDLFYKSGDSGENKLDNNKNNKIVIRDSGVTDPQAFLSFSNNSYLLCLGHGYKLIKF